MKTKPAKTKLEKDIYRVIINSPPKSPEGQLKAIMEILKTHTPKDLVNDMAKVTNSGS